MEQKNMGKILIGIGLVLIGIPLLTSLVYDFSSFLLRKNIFSSINLRNPGTFQNWLFSLIFYSNRISNISQHFKIQFSQTFIWLFIPNIIIISGFAMYIKQNQNIDIKKCFNTLVIVGLVLNILVILNFFGLYSLVYSSFRRSYMTGRWLSFVPRDIRYTSVFMFIYNFSLFLVSFIFRLIPVLPTFIIAAGYIKYFKKENLVSDENASVSNSNYASKAESVNEYQESYFDGGLLQYIGWVILGGLVTVFTFGICFPWALCMLIGWKVNHTVIEGKRLKFQGKALSLFGHWLLWCFLTIITFGIFGFWFFIAINRWITKNTTFENMDFITQKRDNSTLDT